MNTITRARRSFVAAAATAVIFASTACGADVAPPAQDIKGGVPAEAATPGTASQHKGPPDAGN